jgi:hypothetical protein
MAPKMNLFKLARFSLILMPKLFSNSHVSLHLYFLQQEKMGCHMWKVLIMLSATLVQIVTISPSL